MHIDMDAFYASVEQMDNPGLRGKPVIVGGSSMRGVVSASSYEARTFGIRSAMPIFQAKRLCPHGIFVKGRMWRYKEVSLQIMEVLRSFSPLVEQASVDEAYLDAGGLTRVFGPVEDMAVSLKKAVREESGLTCSVGLAPVKFLAKIASDMNKPDGLTIIYPKDVPSLLAQLPVERIPGVGSKTLAALKRLGITYAADVCRYPQDFWERRFGKAGNVLFDRARGKDDRPVIPFEPPKSESAENTFEIDTLDKEFLLTWLLRQSERVGMNLRKQNLAGRTITLKVKYADFTGVTRARTLQYPTNVTRVIFDTAVALFDELHPRKKLRLIGVGVSHFEDTHTPIAARVPIRQLSLLPEEPEDVISQRDSARERAVDKAMDAVRDKFGTHMVVRGKLLAKEDSLQNHAEKKPPAPNANTRSKPDNS